MRQTTGFIAHQQKKYPYYLVNMPDEEGEQVVHLYCPAA